MAAIGQPQHQRLEDCSGIWVKQFSSKTAHGSYRFYMTQAGGQQSHRYWLICFLPNAKTELMCLGPIMTRWLLGGHVPERARHLEDI